MPVSCTPIRRLLSEQRDRTLTTSETQQVRQHLAICPACRTFERNLQAGLASISRLPRVSGGSTVREAVLGKVHPGGHAPWPRNWRDWTGQALKLAGAITAFALVAIVLMNLFSTTDESGPDERLSGVGSQPEAPTAQTQPPTCVDGQVALDLVIGDQPGNSAIDSPENVDFTVLALKSTGGVVCQLTTPVTLKLVDTNGNLLDIQGNPASADLDAILGPTEASVTFTWMNWCGTADTIGVDIEFATLGDLGDAATQEIDTAPACADPDQPSILGQSGMAGEVPDACQIAEIATRPTDDGLQLWILAPNGDACVGDELLSVELTDPDGAPLSVDSIPFEVTMRPSQSGDYRWAGAVWTNWCGDDTDALIAATTSEFGVSMSIGSTPACVDASQPSTVTVSEEEPPAEVWESLPTSDAESSWSSSMPADCEMADALLDLQVTPAGDTIVIELSASYADDNPTTCKLAIRDLSIEIVGPDGMSMGIGTSAAQTPDVNNARQPGDPATMTSRFVWTNWCSGSGPFTITATLATQTTSLTTDSSPACIDATESSTVSVE